MNKSENIINITKAIISVMKALKGIDKTMTVGSGASAYKGVSDKEVKIAIGNAMSANGLCIVPVDVEPTVQVDRWTENTQYGEKQKQSVLATVRTKYLLMHDSGEWMELSGYGHGVDSQDKAAGKATTYALKYTLLYTFMVPTGKIDDSDSDHSDQTPPPPASKDDQKPWMDEGTKEFQGAILKLKAKATTLAKIKEHYRLSKKIEDILKAAIPA